MVASEPRSSAAAQFPSRAASSSQLGLLILAVLYTVHIAKPILLPVVLGLLFSFLLAPLVGALRNSGVPRGLAAFLVVITTTCVLALGLARLFGPAAQWISEAPVHINEIEADLRALLEPVEQVSQAADEVEEALGGEEEATQVAVQGPSLFNLLMARARALVAGMVVTFALILFFLSSGDLFLRKLVRTLPDLESKKRAVSVSRRIRSSLSRHLLTVTAINSGLGLAVGLAMFLLGMPNPLLWGAMAAILNFIPYLGALVGIGIVALISMSTFDGGASLAPPLVYAALTAIEGTFITPAVLGRSMRLNAVAVFLGIVVLGWMWGVPGALLAVPTLSSIKVLGDAYPKLAPWSEFLGR